MWLLLPPSFISICRHPRSFFVSQEAERLLGFSVDDWLRPGFWIDHLHPDDLGWAPEYFASCASQIEANSIEYRCVAKDGRKVWLRDIVKVVTEDGVPRWLRGVMVNITTTKRTENLLHHLAEHDPLTGLANRALFNDRLHRAVASAQRDKTTLALMFLDLDKFKPVNDQYGQGVGDLLLQEVARRMLVCFRDSDAVARVGGDKFVVLLRNVADQQDVLAVAEKIRASLEQPFVLADHSIGTSCCIGIATYPQHGKDDVALCRNADQAKDQAKDHGRNQILMYEGQRA